MRIIFVPQYPTRMRYQEWWTWKIPEEFKKLGCEVVVLGEDYLGIMQSRRGSSAWFAPENIAMELETEQIREYTRLSIKPNDVLFLADLSFPGIFTTALFHHKRPERMYAFCHATSINKGDYFKPYRTEKFMIETAFANSFDKVFVGSKYHQDKLRWKNTVVTYLPFPPFASMVSQNKRYDIMSASRDNPQKIDSELEAKIEQEFSKIQRPVSRSWKKYYKNLAESKILLITAHEDTFGYQIIDAIINGCIPIARRSLAYPEILPDEYLYSDEQELIGKIDYILHNNIREVPVPKILCENEMKNFYKNLIKEMKG